MASNVYCPFCGVILLPDPYRDNPEPPQAHARPWYAEIRGIYSTNDQITITGLGIILFRNKLHAPIDSDESYIDVGIEALERWTICDPSESRWCFAFHNSCWRLLLLRLGHAQDGDVHNKTAILESIFHQLYSIPCRDYSSFQWGHDYGGAAQTHISFGRTEPVDLGLHFYADPWVIPSIHDLEATAPDFHKAHDIPLWKEREGASRITLAVEGRNYRNERVAGISGPSAPDDGRHPLPSHHNTILKRRTRPEKPRNHMLNRLSAEMRFEIFSYLSFDELLNLRLVCRDLALQASIDTLPQSYWRSRFCLGQELDFVFPCLSDTRDWCRLYFGTRASLSARILPLINRKRVRKLLEPIAALVDLKDVLQNGPYGSVFHPAPGQDGNIQLTDGEGAEIPPPAVQIAGSFSGQLACTGSGNIMGEGCRELYHRARSFMAPRRQHPRRIGISTIKIGTRGFISGINIYSSGGCNVVGRLVGYHNPVSEKWIEIPSTSDVKAICVALSSEGLKAIKFKFGNSYASDWVGESNGPGIAYGTLTIPDGTYCCFLVIGLDHFKIVSIGLGKLTDRSGASEEFPQGVMGSCCLPSHLCLWTPHPPQHEDSEISPLLPSQPARPFEPLTNIDFGGPRGLLLASLTKLVFHMASGPYPLMGIEVFYCDGRSVLFGSNRGCGISFLIAGSQGERIIAFNVLEDNRRYHPASGLGGVEVSTNYGRTATFAPLHYRLNAAVGPVPILPFGNTITGFVGLVSECSNDIPRSEQHLSQTRFIRLGIQSQKCDEQPVTPVIPDRECHHIPNDQVLYDERFSHFIDGANQGNYQTYASLKNVRKIQASTGLPARSRCPSRISGLKIEYYSHPTPSVVGQWMNQLDDGFELSPVEEVQSLTIWFTSVGFSTECPGLEVGQVTAIQIETSCSRSVTFRSPDFESLPPRKLQHQYQRSSDEKLTAISWILNVSSDRVRAAMSTNESQKTQMLVPNQEPPFDLVRKLYFQRQSAGGQIETIVTAEAYIRDRAIVGLAFTYTSGTSARIGDFDTDICQTIQFAENARIVGFSAAAAEHELIKIEFEVEENEQPRHKKLRPSISSPDKPANAVGYDWRDVWCKDDASAESHRRLLTNDRIYAPPRQSKLVGIYVGCQAFSRFGALYEPHVSQ
ncbi:hypothetical protein BDV38DRAFT_292569 [Aspergillus pseudotamarii]|uniref:F-box domain-containing protein n=1 Tax=Aspergillus pseudotamarii TaxID=132259 RepID=A0A5N6STI8_ASPPS|nr:uncharacterized protein BDV38DRAFT_292569 [Aspergillus pseudotamarii]KAE8137955.1 hypothetical protein BDV38DRAFT_292569 [Aspergillus pseudotamarii]